MSFPNRHRQVCDGADSYAAKSIQGSTSVLCSPGAILRLLFILALLFFKSSYLQKTFSHEKVKAGTKSRCGARISLYSAVIYIQLSHRSLWAGYLSLPHFYLLSTKVLCITISPCLSRRPLSHFLSPQLSMPLILGVMGSTTTDHMGSNQITVARALDMIRNSDDGQVPSSVNAVLERALGEIWNRISLQPNSYVMSRDEFTIFNRYRSRFDSNRVAQQAVARFWNNFQGSRSEINNQSSL